MQQQQQQLSTTSSALTVQRVPSLRPIDRSENENRTSFSQKDFARILVEG